jgi:hypothetical protein
MIANLRSTFPVYPLIVHELKAHSDIAESLRRLPAFRSPSLSALASAENNSRASVNGPGSVTLTSRDKSSEDEVEEKLFDARVKIKVAISGYAMHIPADARNDLFEKLDEILSEDSWYDEDELPREDSIRDFIKWTIFAKYFNWASIGVSDDGGLLVAYSSSTSLLTLNFLGGDQISWTSKIESEIGIDYAAGKSHLRSFAPLAKIYMAEQVKKWPQSQSQTSITSSVTARQD